MSKIKVLLAEDHTIVRKGIRSLLDADAGIEVVGEAENGREAVEKTETLSPDIVVMDHTMPLLNGLEATRQIRKLDHIASGVPIIAMTANAMRGDETVCLEAGMDGYASKPINKADFFDEMDRVLKQGPAKNKGAESAA